jgi:hypothetical protein
MAAHSGHWGMPILLDFPLKHGRKPPSIPDTTQFSGITQVLFGVPCATPGEPFHLGTYNEVHRGILPWSRVDGSNSLPFSSIFYTFTFRKTFEKRYPIVCWQECRETIRLSRTSAWNRRYVALVYLYSKSDLTISPPARIDSDFGIRRFQNENTSTHCLRLLSNPR